MDHVIVPRGPGRAQSGVWALLVLCAVQGIFSLTSAVAQEAKASAQTAEAVRAKLMSRPQLRSFSGCYTLHRQEMDKAGEVVKTDSQQIEYRFEGENRYLSREFRTDLNMVSKSETPGGDDAQPLRILTNVGFENEFASRIDTECPECLSTDGWKVTVHLRESHFPVPWGIYLDPRVLYGEQPAKSWGEGYSLEEVLSEGESTLAFHDGQRILSHDNDEKLNHIDIFLDDNDRIARIDSVVRLLEEFTEDEIREVWDGDLLDTRYLISTVELSDYMNFNGLELPARARRLNYTTDRDHFHALEDMYKTGQLSPLEFRVRANTESHYLRRVSTVELDVDTVRVNEPLSKSDFTLHCPAGSTIHDRSTDLFYQIGKPFEGSIEDLLAKGYKPTTVIRTQVKGRSHVIVYVALAAILVAISAVMWVRSRA